MMIQGYRCLKCDSEIYPLRWNDRVRCDCGNLCLEGPHQLVRDGDMIEPCEKEMPDGH